MITPISIQHGHVYVTATGHERLIASMSYPRGPNSLVQWRSVDVFLDPGEKSHGSCTARAFARGVVAQRKATQEDWVAFAETERRRKWRAQNKRAMTKYKRQRSGQLGSGDTPVLRAPGTGWPLSFQ